MTYDVTIGTQTREARTAKLVLGKLVLGKNDFAYTREDGASIAKAFSIEPAGEGRYSVLVEGRSYQVVLLENDEIVVNGRTFHVSIEDPRKLRARGSAERGQGRQTIASPMPGRVIRVLVEAGQDVESGQGLIVVEAMKMQNEMKSPKAGKILEIRTSAGAAVAAGDTLLVME